VLRRARQNPEKYPWLTQLLARRPFKVVAIALASVADPGAFRSGRNFSAWIGLVPKQHSSGGKDRLGSISKQGDRYLRSLFVAGALAVICQDPRQQTSAMAYGIAGAATSQGCGDGACQ
jgi:hypothetical protein